MIAREALDAQMRQVLAELAMVSNGRITAYNSAGGGDNDDSVLPPTGDDSPPHLHWARRYGEPFHSCTQDCGHRERPATDDDERQAVLEEARDDLQKARRGERLAVADLDDPETARADLLRSTRGWKPEDVERHHFSHPPARLVRRNRQAAGLNVETGEELATSEGADVRRLVVELQEAGWTERGIAMKLKIHKTQVRRYLGRAA
jgi:hypothetical protein